MFIFLEFAVETNVESEKYVVGKKVLLMSVMLFIIILSLIRRERHPSLLKYVVLMA